MNPKMAFCFENIAMSPTETQGNNETSEQGLIYPFTLFEMVETLQVSIWAGSRCIFSKSYTMARRYEENLTLGAPVHTLLRLEMTNSHHQVFEDVVSVGYNTGFYATLKWILAAPVALAAMPFWWLSQPGAVGRGSLPS